MLITIPTAPTFNFKRTAISHGWYDLPPFELRQEDWTLIRVIDLGKSPPVTVEIRSNARELKVRASRDVRKRAAERITRAVRHAPARR